MCSCGRPQNPDRPITQCARCSEWLHAKCIEQDVLERYLADHADEKPAANGNGHANGDHAKEKTKAKLARGVLGKDLTSQTENNSVVAAFKADHAGQAPIVTITDSRGKTPHSELGEVRCMSCAHKIE